MRDMATWQMQPPLTVGYDSPTASSPENTLLGSKVNGGRRTRDAWGTLRL